MNEFNAEPLAANTDAVNVAAPAEPATPTDPATPAPSTADPTSVEPNPTTEEPPAQPQETETQAFARRLKEKTEAAEKAAYERFNAIAVRLGGLTPDGKPIQTVEDLEKALDFQELQSRATEQNVPVEVLSRLTQAEKDALEAKSMLSEYQRKEEISKEAESLAVDPKWGDFYKAHEAEIKTAAEQAHCDLSTAKLIVYDRLGPTKVDETAIANKAIQEYIEGKRNSYKPIEGSGATPTQVVATPKTYAEARQGSMALFRALREQT